MRIILATGRWTASGAKNDENCESSCKPGRFPRRPGVNEQWVWLFGWLTSFRYIHIWSYLYMCIYVLYHIYIYVQFYTSPFSKQVVSQLEWWFHMLQAAGIFTLITGCFFWGLPCCANVDVPAPWSGDECGESVRLKNRARLRRHHLLCCFSNFVSGWWTTGRINHQ